MQNFAQWNNNKLYSDHVDRLCTIRSRKVKSRSNQKQRNRRSFQIQSLRRTETKHFLPLPLVPETERRLLDTAINKRDMSLKQKELVLQNYLLGRRILSTEPVFKTKQLKKQYQLHRQVRKNMSRSLKNYNSQNQIRESQYKKLTEGSPPHKVGKGSYTLHIKVCNLLLIKGKLDTHPQVLYNLLIKSKSKNSGYKLLTYQDLFRNKFLFHFKRQTLQISSYLKFQIQAVRKNQIFQVGVFCVDFGQNTNFKEIENDRRIQNLTRDRQMVVGTIQYLVSITHRLIRSRFLSKSERKRDKEISQQEEVVQEQGKTKQ